MKRITGLTVGLVIGMISTAFSQEKIEEWKAPESADELVNEFTGQDNIDAGNVSFTMYCTVCHGETGKGDGPGGVSLPIKPKDFTSPEMKKQSDGAIFWKLSNGRGNMVAYGLILSEEERWQLVSYIRTLGGK